MSATWPTYARVSVGSFSEHPSPVVMRSEMERGVPKQRRIASDSLVSIPLTVFFTTRADAANFETWFYTQINGGADFFLWKNPRTDQIVSARIVGGDIGALTPSHGTWKREHCQRSMTLEYLRSAY